MPILGILEREQNGCSAGFNRWLIPPAALAVHLCIGEIYGFSVFNKPLTQVLGIDHSITGQDWTIPEVGWVYSIGLIMLGLSAAVLGKWVEKVGPRKTMVASLLLLWWTVHCKPGSATTQHLDCVFWLWVCWRHRAGARLHLAGIHSG